MALTIKQLTNYSWMSQASYLDYTGLFNGDTIISLVAKLKSSTINGDKVFADSQAIEFTNATSGYGFVNYQPNKDSGFSATVFKSNADGSYTIAVRGTEPNTLADLSADVLGVVLAGKAAGQTIDAYRYYKQLTSTGASNLYSQEELNKLTGLYLQTPDALLNAGDLGNAIIIFQSELQNDVGQGLISAGAKVNFTGHSLGGHVAALLAELVAQQDGISRVGDIATYNAPGMNAIPYEIVNWFTAFGATSIQTGVLGQRHNALVGEGGLDITAGLGQVNGQLLKVFIEDSGLFGGNIAMANHSIVKLSDSLAIKNLFSKLDSAITIPQLDSYIKQSSNTLADSLEKALDVLRKTILGNSITPTIVSGAEIAAAREDLYLNIQDIQNSTTFQSLIGKVTLVASPTSGSQARDDFGAFLSLYYLTPFAIKANDTAADNALKNANLSLKYQWEADATLTHEEILNGDSNFSNAWLTDRVAMLSWVNKANLKDTVTHEYQLLTDFSKASPTYFQDISSGSNIYLGSGLEARRKIIFGSSEDEAGESAIVGGEKNDRLYGMDGNDEVSGEDGNDWIEGGSGQDILNGGAGNDILYGGLDEDILNGGAGDDLLMGGAGVDVYQFQGNYGVDTITDSDGQGFITINSNPANSAVYKFENIYKHDGTGYTYTKVDGGNILVISKEGEANRIIVNNWSQTNNLGINLNDQPPSAPTGNVMNGDFKKLAYDAGPPGPEGDIYYFNGLNYLSDGVEVNAKDNINGTSDADLIYGFGGDDYLSGEAGNDYLYGGDGNDFLQGGTGVDYIYGGDGDDTIYAGAFLKITPSAANLPVGYPNFIEDFTIVASGFNWNVTYPVSYFVSNGAIESKWITTKSNNFLDGSAMISDGSNNYIDAGAGNDYVIGSGGSEYILGGDGSDTIRGFGGDDIILGGSGNDYLIGDENANGEDSWDFTGDDILDGGDGDDIILGSRGNDILFGGDGNDKLYGDHSEDTQDIPGNNFLYGGAGEDQLVGGYGDDYLDGGDDDDALYGGAGNDKLIGGAGADSFTGGAGADTIYLNIKEGDQISGLRESIDTVIYDIKSTEIQDIEAELDDSGSLTSAVKVSVNISGLANRSATSTSSSSSIGTSIVSDADFYHHFVDGDILNSELLGSRLSTLLNLSSADGAIFGGKWSDWLYAIGNANTVMFGGLGNDKLFGNVGNNVLNGGEGDDQLVSGFGDDVLNGGNGNDIQDAGQGNDVLDGSVGNDRMFGGLGNDVYKFDIGYGQDTAYDYIYNTYNYDDLDQELASYIFRSTPGEVDTLEMGTGISASQIVMDLVGRDVRFTIQGTTDNITLYSWTAIMPSWGGIYDESLTIEKVTFADGTVWNLQDMFAQTYTGDAQANELLGSVLNDTIEGLDGDDEIYSFGGNDTLKGGLGNDQLYGGLGDDILDGGAGDDLLYGMRGVDTIIFDRGYGNDVVHTDSYATHEFSDIILLGPTITPNDVILSRGSVSQALSSLLVISIAGTTDTLTIQGYFQSEWFDYPDSVNVFNNASIIRFADGTEWTYEQVISAITPTNSEDVIDGSSSNDTINALSGNDWVYGREGNDSINGGDGNDTIFGNSGNDILDGGAGNDVLMGGLGDDTYLFGIDSGQDAIRSLSDGYDGGFETIQFGENISINDVLLKGSWNGLPDLVISIIGTTDTLTVERFFDPLGVNGSAIEQIRFADGTTWDINEIKRRALLGTSGNDYINGYASNDIIVGLDGSDQLNGGGGDDLLQGGNGSDYLSGNSGNDILDGGAGNDSLDGGDTSENSGTDTFIFGRGYGQDTISSGAGPSWEMPPSINTDILKLGPGITTADVTLSNHNNDLILIINGTTDILTILYYFSPNTDNVYRLSAIHFDDGTIWDHTNVEANLVVLPYYDVYDATGTTGNDHMYGSWSLNGGDGNDTLVGQDTPDTLVGGAGNDIISGGEGLDNIDGGDGDDIIFGGTDESYDQYRIGDMLTGGLGSDTYLFGRGSGREYISDPNNLGAEANKLDVLKFLDDINPSDILVERISDNLVLTISGTTDVITINGYFYSAEYLGHANVDEIRFENGVVWNLQTIKTMVTTGTEDDDYLFAFESDDTLYGLGGNDTLYGVGGNDYIDGGTGSDEMYGGLGDDTYVVDEVGDYLQENNGDGVDTVLSSITYTLVANVENLTLTGSNAINGTGNSLANTLVGNSASNTLNGGNGNDILDGGLGADTLMGGAGNDTYIVDNVGDQITEGSNAGTDTVQSSISYTLGTNLENLTLTGVANIDASGNTGANVLTGNAGNNSLNGLSGTDTMIGGLGNDTYTVDVLTDVITESLNEGIDTVNVGIATASGTYTVAANVENATLINTVAYSLTGNGLDNVLTGNAAINTLTGGAGNDTLNGAGGNDTLIGGLGDDTYQYYLGQGNDQIDNSATDNATAIDTLHLKDINSTSVTLSRVSSDLVVTINSSATVTIKNYYAAGDNKIDQIMFSNGTVWNQADIQSRVPSVPTTGDDILVGTSGNDTIDALAGNDTVSGGDGDDQLLGNNGNDTLNGEAGNDILNGGSGNDTLVGGLGNDTYTVDSTSDVVTENLNEGTDLVNVAIATASGSYTLSANVENGTLTNTVAFTLTGNTLDNVLTGNSAANTLNGGDGNDTLNGMGGNDTMVGGLGNDTYTVDTTGDVVTEASGAGTDTVNVSITTSGGTYTLGSNVENGTLINTVAYTLTGNALNNVLIGNAAANTLNGGDGNDTLNGMGGNDTMVGGLGNDTYTIDATGDVVTEASGAGTDTVNVAIATASGTYTVAANVENAILINSVAYNLTGNALANYLRGNAVNNTLTDTSGGNDIHQGLAGNDILNDTSGNNLFDGGIGTDTITAGSGRDLISGGQGNDTITTGTGYDVIMFNKGDGADIVNASVGTDNTLSLGGDFAYSDLSLSKNVNDLILKVGSSDQITLKDWYVTSANNKSVLNLQVIAEAVQGFSLGGSDTLRNNKVETFNFANLVAAFDTAGATANWQLTDARLSAHLASGSDTAAIGGDIAYQYGKNGSLVDVGLLAAQSVINNASVGQSTQTLNASSSWANETIKLS